LPVDFDIELIEAPAESIPLDNNSADSAIITYTLCTIPSVLQALEEVQADDSSFVNMAQRLTEMYAAGRMH